MIIGAYLGGFLIVGAFIYALLRGRLGTRQKTRAFLATSTVLVLVGLATFILFSMWAGIFTFGETGNFSVPASYVAAGNMGWAIMMWMLLGILSPLFVGIVALRHTKR